MKEAAQAYVSWLWIIRPASSHYFLARLTLSQEGALAVLCACLTHLSPGEQSTCGKSSIIPVGGEMDWRWIKERRRKWRQGRGDEKAHPWSTN